MAQPRQDRILHVCEMISTAVKGRLEELGMTRKQFCDQHKDVVNRPTFDRIYAGANATNFSTLYAYLELLGLTVSITKSDSTNENEAQEHTKELLFSPTMTWDETVERLGKIYASGYNAALDNGWIDPLREEPDRDCDVIVQTRPKVSKSIDNIIVRIVHYDARRQRFVIADSVDVMYWQHLPKAKL